MPLVLSRVVRATLSLIAVVLLTACDPPPLLPPDARLPDGSTYTGALQEGLFHGQGAQEFASGLLYQGQFREGYWHGQGELESPAGWRYEGEFRQGLMAGQGVWEDKQSRYEGAFADDNFNGRGRYEVNGSVYEAAFADGMPVEGKHITDYGIYEGEFRDWYYHGEGTYSYPDTPEGSGALSGVWEYGELVDADESAPADSPAPLTETILAEDRQRLDEQIDSLAAETPGVSDAYFLAVGGDGTESVFMRDIQVARAGLQEQFDVTNRAIMLLNHRDYATYPLATRPSIATALQALDERLNPEEDVLVVHLVSHGGKDGQLLLRQPGIDLPGLSPQDFAEMLNRLNVRRKVLVVSACYSGQWIDPLKDAHTLILTSARSDRTSFGCGDDSEMTWFTKAVYQSVGLSFDDPDAMFEQINEQVREWEEEIGMDEDSWSYPQFWLGEDLRAWWGLRTPGHHRP
ncbi:C13 family peptidase [Halopseudomonas salina]|uniref:Peptidase C13 n=1 Tax=Halopseudomonas salina TaxID=1323744 RepID=A0ABQ1NTQ7_9GAMM|nr:C13 family peptidase [Halopseudomonas salina]GGC84306.1 hypothetical protein GCM10007418_00180 [Halopseudomonas salina]